VQPFRTIVKPAMCIAIQGAYRAIVGQKEYDYRAGHALAINFESPCCCTIPVPSPTRPFMGVLIEIDRACAQEVMDEIDVTRSNRDIGNAIDSIVFELSAKLLDCALRCVRLLETPEAIPVLYRGIMREFCYWLFTGPDGDRIVDIMTAINHDERVARAIRFLKKRFSDPVTVQDLANIAGMSAATLHRQFKSVTSMSPLQYQKQLRLLEARRLMVEGATNVESAAFEVGYQSASHFSREYTRMFGRPPSRDIVSSTLAQSAACFSEET